MVQFVETSRLIVLIFTPLLILVPSVENTALCQPSCFLI